MRTVTVYEADDGTRFTNQLDCMQYEKNLLELQLIMDQLTPRPKSFVEGYIDQGASNVLRIRAQLLRLMEPQLQVCNIGATIDKLISGEWGLDANNCIVGKVIDECCSSAFRKAWFRIMCIDSEGREWSQPFYCLNDHHRTMLEVTKVDKPIYIKG